MYTLFQSKMRYNLFYYPFKVGIWKNLEERIVFFSQWIIVFCHKETTLSSYFAQNSILEYHDQ